MNCDVRRGTARQPQIEDVYLLFDMLGLSSSLDLLLRYAERGWRRHDVVELCYEANG